MKVEVNSQALADAVAWTTRVIDARPATPILAGIRLEAIDGTLQLSAFNYAISARHHIEAGVDEAGSVLVLGKLLTDITKSLPAAKTYLSTDGSTMTITSGKSTFTMQLMPESEYPDLPVVPTKLGQVDSPTFAQAVNQASVAVSREENRPVLTGIRVQFQGDKVIMSSTDRFRLARSSFAWNPADPTISTTAQTPIIMPNIVRKERILLRSRAKPAMRIIINQLIIFYRLEGRAATSLITVA